MENPSRRSWVKQEKGGRVRMKEPVTIAEGKDAMEILPGRLGGG
jgi:hypothetical protein